MRNGMTSGWLMFRERRVYHAGDYYVPCHGNTKHGRYSKTWRERRYAMRLAKAIIRGRYPSNMASRLPKLPLGWQLYPYVTIAFR